MAQQQPSRNIDRAFNQACAKSSAPSAPPKQKSEVPEKTPDAIKRILDAWDKKDYFGLVQLPEPTADDLGRPVWPCTSSDVSKAYRKLSILVHPDKNSGNDARRAFEALNEAHRMLRDQDSLGEVLRSAASRLRADRERAEARSTVDQRIQLNASKNARSKELRKEEGRSFGGTIMEQMKRRQEEAKRKADAASRARGTVLHESEGRPTAAAAAAAAEDSEDDEDGPRVVKKRKKPAFM